MSLTFEEAKILWLSGLDKLKAIITVQQDRDNPLHTYAFSVKYNEAVGERPAYTAFLGYATENEWDADAMKVNLYHQFVNKEYWTPQDSINALIYNQSFLRWYKEDLTFLEPTVNRLKKTILDGWVIHTERPDYLRLLMPLRDIAEKLGIIQEAKETIATAPWNTSLAKVKANFYLFVWSIKSLNDSLAVFLKNWYTLPEKSGNIDLGKGIGAKGTFLVSLREKNKSLAEAVARDFQPWINEVKNYRNHTIHRFGVLVTMRPGAGYWIPKDPKLDPYQVESMSVAEADAQLQPIVRFSEGWRIKAWALARLTIEEISKEL